MFSIRFHRHPVRISIVPYEDTSSIEDMSRYASVWYVYTNVLPTSYICMRVCAYSWARCSLNFTNHSVVNTRTNLFDVSIYRFFRRQICSEKWYTKPLRGIWICLVYILFVSCSNVLLALWRYTAKSCFDLCSTNNNDHQQ